MEPMQEALGNGSPSEADLRFMRLAVEEARKSVVDREGSPQVGAVLSKGGALIASAFRGREAVGDHAEFTLLQKDLRSTDLTRGATLYTTLEPCTTRSHDKLPCVEWIIRKGIAKVFIGILDPNPNICGRGGREGRGAHRKGLRGGFNGGKAGHSRVNSTLSSTRFRSETAGTLSSSTNASESSWSPSGSATDSG